MPIIINGVSEHAHSPCQCCGYATRYKQFDLCCACTTPDRCPHPPIWREGNHCHRCGGDARVRRESMYGKERLQEIWAEQEQKNARAAYASSDECPAPADSRPVCGWASEMLTGEQT